MLLLLSCASSNVLDSSRAADNNNNFVIFISVIFIIGTSPFYALGWHQRAWGCSNGGGETIT
jgi:hypothetical protein